MPRSDSSDPNDTAESGDDATTTAGDAPACVDAADAADAAGNPSDPREAASDALACICNPGDLLDLLARRHAIPVVCAVGALEPARYRDVADALGDVSSSTLSTRFEDLVDAGVLSREQYDEIPPRVEYELTADGEALCDALLPLVQWARERDDAGS